MRRFLAGSCLIVLLHCMPVFATEAEPPRWGYSGEFGPENWHKADPAFFLCRDGKNQTPIDIVPRYDVALPLLKAVYERKGESVLNNGHTVQVSFPAGGMLVVEGDRAYGLQQVHFHSPSENTLDGRSFPLEAHFVHADKDGNPLVLAVFYREGPEHPGIAAIWKHMPEKPGRAELPAPGFDPLSLLPASLEYIYFNGSLTTPPCSEGVRWCVLKSIGTVGQAQAQKLVEVLGGGNNRPPRPLNARPVLE